jgi:hypothetical protein
LGRGQPELGFRLAVPDRDIRTQLLLESLRELSAVHNPLARRFLIREARVLGI